MKKNLRWKILIVILVVVGAILLAYPPGVKIKRGLDLEGGMHLVLQVITDDAIENETDQEILRLEDHIPAKRPSSHNVALGSDP